MTYVAYYAPMLSEGDEDPSREFDTAEEAWTYVFDMMCSSCRESRERALQGDEECSTYPACSAEWFVVPTDKLEQAEDFRDVLDAAGYTEVIYRRPEVDKDVDGTV